MRESSLLNTLRPANLALDLLASPACCVDSSDLELAVLASVLDHLGEPISAVVGRELSVRKGISKVPELVSIGRRQNSILITHPITPIEARIRASLLF
jgi:hypothetical protein